MKVKAKQMRQRKVELEFELISAGHLMQNIPSGLWQSLNKKSVLSGEKFPPGSNIAMVMYRDEHGNQCSGAVHLHELPPVIHDVVAGGALWTSKS